MITQVLVTIILYHITNANHVRHKELAPLLISLKDTEEAAADSDVSRIVNKPVLQSDEKLTLEDVIKEQKLRKVLELLKENNRGKQDEDLEDQSGGPRIFVIKEDVLDDYKSYIDRLKTQKSRQNLKVNNLRRNKQEKSSLRRHSSRLNSEIEIPSDVFEEKRRPAMDFTHLGPVDIPKKTAHNSYSVSADGPLSTPIAHRDRYYQDDSEEYTTKRLQNPLDSLTGNDWDDGRGPLRNQQAPKYTDGPFKIRNDNEREDNDRSWDRVTAMGPVGREKQTSKYKYSKENRWESKVLRGDNDDSEERAPKETFRRPSYGWNRNRGNNQLVGRTQIPYSRNRNVYE